MRVQRGGAANSSARWDRRGKENRPPEEDPGAGKAPRRAGYGRAAIAEPMTRIAKRRSQRTKRASDRDAGAFAVGRHGGSSGRATNFTCAMRCERREMDFMAAIIGAGVMLRRGRIRRPPCGIFGNTD